MSLIITVTATPVATMLSPYHSTITKFCDEMTTGYSPGIKLDAGISQIADFSTELCVISAQ